MHRGGGPCDGDEFCVGFVAVCGDGPGGDAPGAEEAGEGAGVDACDGGDVVLGEPIAEGVGGAVVGVVGGVFVDDEPGDLGPGGFVVLGVDAGVSDQGGGLDQYLTRIGGIGEGFLVSGEGGVEDNLACGGRGCGCAEGRADKHGSVCECEAGVCDGVGVGHRDGVYGGWC